MMNEDIDEETITTLSQLCRISCTQEEKKKLAMNLRKILSYVKELDEVDTANVPPCYTVLSEVTCPLREDVPHNSLDRKLFLDNSASHIGGMIRVPPVKR